MADDSAFSVVIKLDALNVVNIDLKDIYRCFFQEDIYSFGTLGKITMFDRYGLKEYGPLTGDETVDIIYGESESGLVAKTFSMVEIAKISGVTEAQAGHTSVIEVYFTEVYFKNLTMKKFSKSWNNAKASDIVTDIINNMLDINLSKTQIETSDKPIPNFCMMYWTPADTIRWLSARAKGTQGRCNYGYLFFSNSKNYINFITLDNILVNGYIDPQIYMIETTDASYENKILSWQVYGVDQIGIRELGGGQLLGFDPKKKQFLGIELDESFIYSKAVKQITTLGNSSLYDGNVVDNDSSKFNYLYTLEGETDKNVLKNIFYNNFIRRYSLQNMVKAIVAGSSKRYAGMKININWPSMNPEELYSSMDSGAYLIKSIFHSFTPLYTPLYTQSLTLIKNGYNSNKFNTTTGTSGGTLGNLVFGGI
jgi:hypothetical protein